MEKKMENEMESWVIKGLFRDPSIQIVPTLGPEVCKFYLHWAISLNPKPLNPIWIPRAQIKIPHHPFRSLFEALEAR